MAVTDPNNILLASMLRQQNKRASRPELQYKMGQALITDQQPTTGWGDALANIGKSIAGGYTMGEGAKGMAAEDVTDKAASEQLISQMTASKLAEAPTNYQYPAKVDDQGTPVLDDKGQPVLDRSRVVPIVGGPEDPAVVKAKADAGRQPADDRLKMGAISLSENTPESVAEAIRTNDVTKLVRLPPQAAPKEPAETFGESKFTKAQVDILNEQQEKYQADPRVKQHQSIQPLVGNARQADDTKVGDEALVKTFAKLTDPNTGVLQGEAEAIYGTTLRGLYTQAKGFFDSGARIPPEIRASLMANINRLANGIKDNYDVATGEYGARLEQRGIPGSALVPRPKQPQGGQQPPPAAPSSNAAANPHKQRIDKEW